MFGDVKLHEALVIYLGTTKAKLKSCQACLNSVCYSRSRIVDGIKFSGQLAIDRSSNILYFHYKNRSIDFTAAFDINNARLQTLSNISFSFGHAVDQKTNELFMTGAKGLYRYYPTQNVIKLYGLTDKTIWHLQYEDKLYYSEFQKKGIYTYVDKKSKIIQGTNYQIDDFIIDKRGDIYFMHNYTTYLLKNGSQSAEIFEDEIYSLTIDKNGDAYFIQPFTRAIYKMIYNTERRVLKEFGAFRSGSAFKVIFDGDNDIIYYDGTDKKLYYLSPTMNRCVVRTKSIGRNMKKRIRMF
ncbi:unnamed protein product [Leptidea sinapis]|uniref:Ommochrome-binding protein-like n=1 Tax=Leptidea sinapis TaxID=189913 RepID=A0A5E4QUQ0_9NEOP|nr:unnamed protein product [Leptidea sinapis]